MKLALRYRDLGYPTACQFVVSDHGPAGQLIVFPPTFPSYLIRGGKVFRITGDVTSNLRVITDASLPHASRVGSGIRIRRGNQDLLMTTDGTTAFSISRCFEATQPGSDLLGWLGDDVEATEAEPQWVALGHTTAFDLRSSVRDRLACRSNDYWLADRLWSLLVGENIVSDDVDSLASVEAYGSISVVIPARGANDTINQVVQSVLESAAQLPSTVQVEIVVIDDAGERRLVLDQRDDRITVIRAHQQVHCGGARNIGVAVSSGECVLFLDGDTLIPTNYLPNHWLRHRIFPTLLLVSMREPILPGLPRPLRSGKPNDDSRWEAHYTPEWIGLHPVVEQITVRPLLESDYFRTFGYGTTIGPTDLPFMVKGNNLSVMRRSLGQLRFHPRFRGWGPEDVCFAAMAIAGGHFVVPVMPTGVFHVEHDPRSGSIQQQWSELRRNLAIYREILDQDFYDEVIL